MLTNGASQDEPCGSILKKIQSLKKPSSENSVCIPSQRQILVARWIYFRLMKFIFLSLRQAAYLLDPFLLVVLTMAVKRVCQAIDNGEAILNTAIMMWMG